MRVDGIGNSLEALLRQSIARQPAARTYRGGDRQEDLHPARLHREAGEIAKVLGRVAIYFGTLAIFSPIIEP